MSSWTRLIFVGVGVHERNLLIRFGPGIYTAGSQFLRHRNSRQNRDQLVNISLLYENNSYYTANK
jgi:hypothetical protein